MKRIALVALPLVVVGCALVVVLLLARRRRDAHASTAEAFPATDVPASEEAGDPTGSPVEVLQGYDEQHEAELEARHGAVLHVSAERISVSQV